MVGFISSIVVVLIGLMPFNVQAETKVERYQKQVSKNLKGMPTDTLVWVRAYNNTYRKFCKNHSTSKVYNVFFEVATRTIVDEMTTRDDWSSPTWQVKYGFRKGLLKGLRNRIGNDGYCNCIYDHLIKGKSDCLNQ